MNLKTIIAVVLIAAGIFIVAYGSFTYTKKTHKADLGVVTLSLDEKETVKVPIWAGVVAIVIGGGLLILPLKKS